MKIAIVGHGPGAISLASHNRNIWGEEECDVSILELKENRVSPSTRVRWPDGNVTSLQGCKITRDAEKAISDATVILFCNPLNSYPEALKKISNYVTNSLQLLCGAPGATGFDWMVKEAFLGKERNFTIGAIESLPFISKRKNEDEIEVLAIKRQLHFAIQHPASSIQHPASSIQHPASSIQHPASSIQHPASSIQHPASSIQH